MTNFSIDKALVNAEELAQALADANVDPNEAQKALAYMRSQKDGRALFDYLETIVRNGGAVIRSGRTLSYYRDLLQACKAYLKPLQNNYAEMLWTFGWSLRLLRYYRAVPAAVRNTVLAPRPTSHPAGRTHFPRGRTTSAPKPPEPPVDTPPPPLSSEELVPAETRSRGIITDVATPDDVGVLEDAEGRTYRYSSADVIGTPPGERALVLFRPEKRKINVKKGKKKTQKYVPWAEDVEQQGG